MLLSLFEMYLNIRGCYIIIKSMVVKIAISGKMCSGKSFCSKMIQQRYPRFQIFSFAEKLKLVAHDLFSEQFNIVGGKEQTVSQMHKNRKLYVDVGQKMKDIDPNVWTNYVLKQSRDVDFAIIDDLRFKNEMDALKDDGWKLVRLNVTRDQQINRLKSIYSNSKEHILGLDSETERDLDDVLDSNFDLVLNQEESGVNIYHLLEWVDDLVGKDLLEKGERMFPNETVSSSEVGDSNCCKADCSDCEDSYKMTIVDFEKYIKDNGVIC